MNSLGKTLYAKYPGRWTATPLIASLTLGAFSWGCLSHEYAISKQELSRLAQVPPENRARSITVVQEIGDRRSPALDPSAPPPPPPPYAYDPNAPAGAPMGPAPGYPDSSAHVGVGIILAPGGHSGSGPGMALRPAQRAPAPSPRAAPIAPSSSSGPRGKSLPGKTGGNSDDLVILVAVLAAVASVGMVATEGLRWDGTVATYPEQPIHLLDAQRSERIIPLAALTPADVASASEAKIMDDEGYGLFRLERRPLDRKGFAFKANLGGMDSQCACYSLGGFAANLQLGYFPHHRIGLLASTTLAGGDDAQGDGFTRYTYSGELQVFPLSIWRLHLGGFAHVGSQSAWDSSGKRQGLGVGGGLLLEVALTTRLALTFRADYGSAKIAEGGNAWADTLLFAGGIAIY